MRSRIVAGLIAGLLGATSAHAISITSGAFGASMVVENFEGVAVGANVAASAFGNIVLPGSASDYTFGSGVTLKGPNPGLFANGAFLHNAAVAGAVNNWGANGSVSNGAQVPDPWGLVSTTYLGAFDNIGAGSAVVDMSFASDMLRVGAWVAGGAGTTITLEAYDASNNLLESVTIAAPTVAAWGTAGSFVGLERSEGIRRVVFRGADFGLDGLTFEAGAPLGEPSLASLSWLGIGGLWVLGNRRRRG